MEGVVESASRWRTPLLIGIPTLGTVRIEWAAALHHMVLPVNLSSVSITQPYHVLTPLRYHVADAQNLIVREAVSKDYEWLFLLEDDVVPPPNTLLQFAKWIHDGRFPMVSGWYNVKSYPPQPMFFRGRGNGPLCHTLGEVDPLVSSINPELELRGVLCDGVPTGCLLVSVKLLRHAWDRSRDISLSERTRNGTVITYELREVFKTTREAGIDPESGGYYKRMGTSDLEFCDRTIDNGWLKEAGFDYAASLPYPFVVDTDIRCGHIELATGRVF